MSGGGTEINRSKLFNLHHVAGQVAPDVMLILGG